MASSWDDVSPASPVEDQPTIGLIGMGAMGRMYTKYLSKAGWKKIHVCDQPTKYEELKAQYDGVAGVSVLPDGHAVARSSDFIMYSVEAEFIDRVVAQYGPSTKLNAVVAGQTSVKAPEKAAFEKYLPQDAHIVSCHSLHGPGVSPVGQPLVLIRHRAPPESLRLVENILRSFGSRYVYLSYDEHDLVTANTQAVTHAAFLSMGTSWASVKAYPWEHGLYVGGIETAKVNITLRIYSNAWHVYAGLAILNPSAKIQIDQFAESATELFKLMLQGNAEGGERRLRERVEWARQTVFGDQEKDGKKRIPILLSADVLDRFSLGRPASGSSAPPSPGSTPNNGRNNANSHLSLLAMVDCWAKLKIQPFHHLALAATPIFRLFLGVAEHLFLSPTMLDSAIHSGLHDTWHRRDDLEFVIAARGWSQCVSFGSFELYRRRFEQTRVFFEERFEQAGVLGSEMIKAIMESEKEREEKDAQS
ncbi:prephenate dehydrogenase [Mycena alexandri]|uniref:Prephenate dehydrogenase n=1 Tax=Mycena alexandri TaxID=1745969 RepID=A0AAD6TKQ8_9AGAR|nr:prephenate dehydrogenase [Mycena alexandri]